MDARTKVSLLSISSKTAGLKPVAVCVYMGVYVTSDRVEGHCALRKPCRPFNFPQEVNAHPGCTCRAVSKYCLGSDNEVKLLNLSFQFSLLTSILCEQCKTFCTWFPNLRMMQQDNIYHEHIYKVSKEYLWPNSVMFLSRSVTSVHLLKTKLKAKILPKQTTRGDNAVIRVWSHDSSPAKQYLGVQC